jgi:hypothetical protein
MTDVAAGTTIAVMTDHVITSSRKTATMSATFLPRRR